MSQQEPIGTLAYAPPDISRRRGIFGALLAISLAWAAYATGQFRVAHLDLSRWGLDPDIAGSLAIDGYRAKHMLPFIAVAVALDLVAIAGSWWVSVGVGPKRAGICALVLSAASLLFHGFILLITNFFASA